MVNHILVVAEARLDLKRHKVIKESGGQSGDHNGSQINNHI